PRRGCSNAPLPPCGQGNRGRRATAPRERSARGATPPGSARSAPKRERSFEIRPRGQSAPDRQLPRTPFLAPEEFHAGPSPTAYHEGQQLEPLLRVQRSLGALERVEHARTD